MTENLWRASRCESFRETETHIGFAIPAATVKDEGEQGIAYPMDDRMPEMVAGASAK